MAVRRDGDLRLVGLRFPMILPGMRFVAAHWARMMLPMAGSSLVFVLPAQETILGCRWVIVGLWLWMSRRGTARRTVVLLPLKAWAAAMRGCRAR
ncbi:hypothetical protein K440DRAFT_27469 [Wilcoxina mikolae CBS 423.85]|nr:hypothetical protein K440DRAFT_27469 [Wilcoxina mikolae CBS 423.85]